jgi:hypothetical protein
MNDEELIWEAYTKKNHQPTVSPLKKLLIMYIEGLYETVRSIRNFKEYGVAVQQGYKSSKITPEVEKDVAYVAREMMGKDLEDVLEDDFRNAPNAEDKVESMMYDTIEELKTFGYSEEQAEDLLKNKIEYYGGVVESEKDYYIEKVLKMNL